MTTESRDTNQVLSSRVVPLLSAGERLQTVFAVRSGTSPQVMRKSVARMALFPPLCLWIAVGLCRTRHRVIAVTDQAIHIFGASRFSPRTPRELLGSAGRETALVPHREEHWSSFTIDDELLWVRNDDLGHVCAANQLRTKVNQR